MKNEIVRCTRCKHIHSISERVDRQYKKMAAWSVSCCPKCYAHTTIQVSLLEYEAAIEREQRLYPALKDEETRPDWIHEAYGAGMSPIQFLNSVITDCF